MARHDGCRRVAGTASTAYCNQRRRGISRKIKSEECRVGGAGDKSERPKSGEAGGRKNQPTKLQLNQCRVQLTQSETPVRDSKDLKRCLVLSQQGWRSKRERFGDQGRGGGLKGSYPGGSGRVRKWEMRPRRWETRRERDTRRLTSVSKRTGL